MKRIELVIEHGALERFIDAAHALELADFDITEVRRLPSVHRGQRQRIYRGIQFNLELVERLKIDLTVEDKAAAGIAQALIKTLAPESVAILRLDHAAEVGDAVVASAQEGASLTAVH